MKLTAFLFLISLPFLQASPLAAGLSPRKTTLKSTTAAYNVLKPKTGCIPQTCGKCKRDVDLLPRANVPYSPVEKTETGLNVWTKGVFDPNLKT